MTEQEHKNELIQLEIQLVFQTKIIQEIIKLNPTLKQPEHIRKEWLRLDAEREVKAKYGIIQK